MKTPRAPRNYSGYALGMLLKLTADRINARKAPADRSVAVHERRKWRVVLQQIRQHRRTITRLTKRIERAGLELNHADQLVVRYAIARQASGLFSQHQARSREALQRLKLQAYLDMPALSPKEQHEYVLALQKQLEVL